MASWLATALSALKTVAVLLKLRTPKPGPDVAPVPVPAAPAAPKGPPN